MSGSARGNEASMDGVTDFARHCPGMNSTGHGTDGEEW